MSGYGEPVTSAQPPDASTAAAVAVVVTGHREGTLAHPTFRALARSIRAARDGGLPVEVLGVLDRADDATREIFHEALGSDGTVGSVASCRVVEVDHGDPGAARNEGVRHSTAPWVCVLDADNLPSRDWLLAAHRRATEAGAPCVVHAENLVVFGGRWQVWPQLPGDDPGFRAENFFDRNYWDTFCLASREVFEKIPYVPTRRLSGFGPEDWHWAMETVQAGIPHTTAPGTALFYRVKRTGSVQGGHHEARSLLPPTPLLTDPARATSAATAPRPSRRRPRGLQRAILRHRRHKLVLPPLPAPVPAAERPRWRRDGFVWPPHVRFLYPETADMTDQQVRDHVASVPGRRGWLDDAALAALSRPSFNVLHYRALETEALRLPNGDAMVHYLEVGLPRGRRARLTRAELRDVAALDLDDYRELHEDLTHHDDDELLNHYLVHGRVEGRRASMTPEQRDAARPVEVGQALATELRELHELEPAVPVPSETALRALRYIGPARDGSLTDGSSAWWKVVARLGAVRPDIVFFAPWIRMGGGDILLARYANAVARLRPGHQVVVVTTHGDSTRPEWLDDRIVLIDLPSLPEWSRLTLDERRRLLATFVIQYQPDLVHAFNSPEFFDAVEDYPRALEASTTIYLSTFVVDRGRDGEMANHLFHRPTDYLAAVAGVIVDNHSLVEQFHELYRMPREKFWVHHQPVELPPARPRPQRRPEEPLRVMWAARFDKQKRLDVLADVAEAARRKGLQVEWHVYGAPVIESEAAAQPHIERLEACGAVFHGTYRAFDELPLEETDLFLLTSESEGIPLTLLDVLAHRLPVMAPMVGGIPEVVTRETGWPIDRFDDVDAYVEALAAVAGDPAEAARRADAGHEHVATEFSWARFEERLRELPGYLP